MSSAIEIYTDGACRRNPGPGGYAAIITGVAGQPFRQEVDGGERRTTNQRMELAAIIAGLEALPDTDQPATVYTDSRYAADAINKGWIRNWKRNGWRNANRAPVANQDLMRRLYDAVHSSGRKVTIRWVKGHAGIPLNEAADRLAVRAAARYASR